MSKLLEYPFTLAKVRDLKAGQLVRLSGKLFTGRDRLHKFLFDGGTPPVEVADAAIYHCGPVVVREGGAWVVRAAGPTTSGRLDRYMARIIEDHRVRVIIGKGGMGERTRGACSRHGCVYLQAVGGAAVILAQHIQKVLSVHFLKEFGSAEAMWELDVKDFPAMVAIDTHNSSVHKTIKTSSKRVLMRLLR